MSSRKEPLRFRLYYRLMDLSLVVYLLGLILAFTVQFSELEPSTFPTIIGVGIPVIVQLVTTIVLPVLIVAAKMRDEYADLLWKRTVAQLTVLTVLLPPITMGLLWFLFLVVSGGDPEANRPDWLLDQILAEEEWFDTVYGLWRYYTLGFVILFQFNRFRDSRASSE